MHIMFVPDLESTETIFKIKHFNFVQISIHITLLAKTYNKMTNVAKIYLPIIPQSWVRKCNLY